MAPKHASETAAMNIYESSYDLSWASPTLRLAIHSQLFTWTYLFWIRSLVQIACGGRYGFYPKHPGLYPKHPGPSPEVWYLFGPQKHTSTKHGASRGVTSQKDVDLGCFSPHGTCQVLLLVLRRTTIVPRKRCQVMSKNSVAVETRIRRLVRIGG